MEGQESIRRVEVDLWEADAIVLRDWLEWVQLDDIPIRHRAEKQALMDLLTRLEEYVVAPTQRAVDQARDAVARDMGW